MSTADIRESQEWIRGFVIMFQDTTTNPTGVVDYSRLPGQGIGAPSNSLCRNRVRRARGKPLPHSPSAR